MKKLVKKLLTIFVLASVIITSVSIAPVETQASERVYMYRKNITVTYETGDVFNRYYTVLTIIGCSNKAEIKNLKSSNKNVKVEKNDGYITVIWGDEAANSTITCTVKGVKLKTTVKVVKYVNPISSIKIGSNNITKKYNNTGSFTKASPFKNKKVSIKMKKGWTIDSISIKNKKRNDYYVGSSTFVKTLTLTENLSYISVQCHNKKTGVYENIAYYVRK